MFAHKRNLILSLTILGGLLVTAGCHKKEVRAPAAPAAPPPAPAAPAPPPQPTVSLTVSPATVEKGQSATLAWTTTNATDVEITPDIGKVGPSGSSSVSPTDSTTYILTATGPGGRATESARLTVSAPAPPPVTPGAESEVQEEQMFETEVRDAYFDFNKSDIREDAQQTLTANAAFFKAHPNLNFTVEGHCDERGSEEYNLGLGERRAESAKEFLVNLGVSADRIFTISYGKERPQCTDHTEECWQKNRRAHFKMGRESK
jgi:peptidoglycan-associated lipoprotein